MTPRAPPMRTPIPSGRSIVPYMAPASRPSYPRRWGPQTRARHPPAAHGDEGDEHREEAAEDEERPRGRRAGPRRAKRGTPIAVGNQPGSAPPTMRPSGRRARSRLSRHARPRRSTGAEELGLPGASARRLRGSRPRCPRSAAARLDRRSERMISTMRKARSPRAGRAPERNPRATGRSRTSRRARVNATPDAVLMPEAIVW